MIRLKRSLLRVLMKCGLGTVCRKVTSTLPRILMYHKFADDASPLNGAISSADFEKQLAHISKHYTSWMLSDLIQYYKKNGVYPENAVAITVDDGYENFFTVALPLMKAYGLKATVFIVAEATDKYLWLWFDFLDYLSTFIKRSNTAFTSEKKRILELRLKSMTAIKRCKVLEGIISRYSVSVPASPDGQYRLMSWMQIRKALDTGLVEIGGHTNTHPILTYLSEEESFNEIVCSKQLIEDRLGIQVTSFCHPNGQPGDYTAKQIELLKTAGYTCGTASHYGLAEPSSNLYALPRLSFPSNDYLAFLAAVDGFDHLKDRRTQH